MIYNTIPEGSNLKIECSGYAAKIENRLFNQYINDEFKIYRGTYDKVLFSMLKDINSYYYTGINQGDAQYISLDTERKIEWNDNFYEKLNDFTGEFSLISSTHSFATSLTSSFIASATSSE